MAGFVLKELVEALVLVVGLVPVEVTEIKSEEFVPIIPIVAVPALTTLASCLYMSSITFVDSYNLT